MGARAFDRAAWLRAWLGQWGLPIWFVGWSIASVGLLVLYEFPIGLDARIYHAAAVALLQGGDPWDAQASVYYFSGLPPTVLAFAPFAFLPEGAFTVLWLALTLVAALYIVRSLRLPWWWLLFPPLAEGLFSGNPQIVLLALLLSVRSAFLAPVLKVYALVPLIGERRWGSVVAALAVLGATVLLAPGLWGTYLGELGRISDYLFQQANGGFSAYYHPVLLLAAVVALGGLVLVDLRAAGWLAVIAVWPSTQFHYSTMAMPLMGSGTVAMAVFAAALAVPVRGLPAVAVIGYAAWRGWAWWRARRASRAGRAEAVAPSEADGPTAVVTQ